MGVACPRAGSRVLTPDVSLEPLPRTFPSVPVFLWLRVWAGAGDAQSQALPGLGAVWQQEAVLSGARPPEPAGTPAAVTAGVQCPQAAGGGGMSPSSGGQNQKATATGAVTRQHVSRAPSRWHAHSVTADRGQCADCGRYADPGLCADHGVCWPWTLCGPWILC